MKLDVLRGFVRIAEEGSVSRAADALYVSQPTLSNSIKALEAELDLALFDRSNRGMEPTEAGMEYYHAVKSALRLLDEGLLRAKERQGGSRTLRLGCGWQDTKYIFADLCAGFLATHPDVSIVYSPCPINDYAPVLAAGDIDVCLACRGSSIGRHGFAFAPLFEDPIECEVYVGHPLASKKPLSLGDLTGQTVVLPSPGVCACSDCMREELTRPEIGVRVVDDVDRTVLPAFESAQGYVVLHPSWIRPETDCVTTVPLNGDLRAEVGLAYLPNPRKTVSDFIEFAQKVYERK